MSHDQDHDDDDRVPGLRGYRLDQAPTRDLWPGIAARLPARRRRARWIPAYAAAATLLLALATQLALREPAPGPAARPTPVTVAAATPRPTAPLRQHDDNRLLVRANLKIVDDAEKQLEQALRAAPDAAYLKRLLDSTRGQRRDLRSLLARAT